jgi:hypothetical protein
MGREEAIRELTLMLMRLTSWTEKGFEQRRFWKGYDFDVLDSLEADDLVLSSHKAKSAYLTERGEQRAEELLRAYGLEDI